MVSKWFAGLDLINGVPKWFFVLDLIKGVPKWFFGQVFFGRLGVPRQRNHTFSGTEWFVGLAVFGNKPLIS